MKRVGVAILISFILVSQSFGWSAKEHIQITRIAAMNLMADPATPQPLKDWLKKQYPQPLNWEGDKDYFLHTHIGTTPEGYTGLSWQAIEPDNHAFAEKTKIVEPFGVIERTLHFIDLELFIKGDAPRVYKHDLSNKPKAEDIPHDMKDERWIQAGMLPFAVEHSYKELVKSIKENRLDETPESKNDNAVRWAGYLAHYAEDNTQPLHATIDYQCETYFANKKKAPKVHFQLEYMMADDEKNEHAELRQEFWPLFEAAVKDAKDPIETNDPWEATIQVSLASYDAIPMVGLAAMAAAKQAGTPDHPTGPASEFSTEVFYRFKGELHGKSMTVMQMKANQQGWAVKRVERLFKQAWEEAGKKAD